MDLADATFRDEPGIEWPRRLRMAVLRDVLAFAGVLAVAMASVGFILSWQTIGFLRQNIDMHLLTDARSIAAEAGPSLLRRLSLAIDSDPSRRRVGGVFDASGKKVAGNLDAPPHPLPALGSMGTIDEPARHPPPGRGGIRVGRLALPDGGTLIFGRRVDEFSLVHAVVERTLLFAAAPMIVLSLAGGWLIWRISVGRLCAVEASCARIMAGDFRQRLPAMGRIDGFLIVSITINRMLDEVERLMKEFRGVGDSMAHDLQTPMTRLRTRLGRIAESGMDIDATRTAVTATIKDVDQLIATIRAILRLGAIENGEHRSHLQPIDVATVADSAAELYAPIAEEKGLGFVCEVGCGAFAPADGQLLFEAVANLLDNAVKFTPPGGTVALRLFENAGRLALEVEDTGPGIPEQERDAVKRRFYRGDPARGVVGSGLGLAIVAAIAKLHAAEFELTDGSGGAGCRATLRLPSGIRSPGRKRAAKATEAGDART